jgi:hypothetical protein
MPFPRFPMTNIVKTMTIFDKPMAVLGYLPGTADGDRRNNVMITNE